MVRVSFRICAWTILLTILCAGYAECLEARKQRHPSIQGNHHLGIGYTESLSAQLKMEVMTVELTQAATRHSAAERQNLRNKRSFPLEGSSSRPTTSMSLNNVTSVIGKLNSTKVTRNFSQIKETCTLPRILMNSSKSPSSENVITEFIRELQRGNSTSVPPTAPSWPKVTLPPSMNNTVSTSTYEKDLNELFGAVQSDQGDSSAAAQLLVDSLTERSISRDNRGNIGSDERTLLKLDAPEILLDADSIVEQNSPEFTHLRVKRDKLLNEINASYPLQEDLHLNSSQLRDLPYSFSTSSQSPYRARELNHVSSSIQPEYRLPVQESRLSFLPISRVIMNERSNSNSNALNDVYPDFVNNFKSPIPMVQFIRKKRQMLVNDNFLGDPSNYRKVLEESYPEDDKVIESMLSKFDYNTLGRNALVRASPLQVQGNWAIGRSGKKRQTPPANLVSRYKKKAMRNKHDAQNCAQRKEKSLKHAKVHSKEKKYLQADPNRPMLDRSVVLDAGAKNAMIVKQKRSTVVPPHDVRGQEEYFEGAEQLQHQTSESNLERRRFKRHEDDASDTSRRRAKDVQELQYYEDIHEPRAVSRGDGSFAKRRRRSRTGRAAKSVEEIKELVEKLVAKVAELQNYVSNDGESRESRGSRKKVELEKTSESNLKEEPGLLEHSTSKHEQSVSSGSETSANGKVKFQETQRREERPNSVERIYKATAAGGRRFRRARRKRKSHRKWDRWTDWSSCSVTCGKGRQIRWRHCIHDCTTAETEMEEKACQLPACAPGKFLGIF